MTLADAELKSHGRLQRCSSLKSAVFAMPGTPWLRLRRASQNCPVGYQSLTKVKGRLGPARKSADNRKAGK